MDLGPYFALAGGEPDPGAGWRPAAGLAGQPGDLAAIIDDVAGRLGGAPRWVAASVFYQGWAARLTSVYAGSAVLGRPVPDLSLATVHYRFGPAGPAELLACPRVPLPHELGWQRLSDDHLSPLADAIRGEVRIGPQVLRGNLASALAGSIGMLAAVGLGSLEGLASQPWARPAGLADCGAWSPGPAGPAWRRRNCCGYVQLPGAGRCGDCSLSWGS